MRKGWVVAIGAIPALFALAFLASPYLAARKFVAWARQGDTERLAASVDFPAVRASLKPQLSAAVTARMNRDPEMRDNPLAGLGMMLMPSLLDRMVDSVVTPRGLATLVSAGRTGRVAESAEPPRLDYDYGYTALDRFRVTARRQGGRGAPLGLTFERRGLFWWKLVGVDLPQDMLADRDEAESPA